ncbi:MULTISPECIES: hypothetical protein [unclassified Geobacillus]|uniref:hypothetical protein n=1 Tax=unclassified Geobacillus TaxID=2642459 RepID=UPI000BE327F8|nr:MULTISPECIES: hypothetical protein [unclassified Geobacillus]PDM38785.1 hypothetical protein CN643_17470 [Parageobacillus yumthangensis]RDV23434.1 hypothetical protein DXK91_02435 [Parageobacillus toebii]TXK88547.1 hypothetical protein FVE68_04365 [Geobacillus sp. AYS3]TXK90139.1 hypothetical protein FVE24_13205 [Parageobacillus sp. SY1]
MKSENKRLNEKLSQISKEFSAFKQKVTAILYAQIDRVKTFLRIKDADQKYIKYLDDKRDTFVQDSLDKLEKPQKSKEMELGR